MGRRSGALIEFDDTVFNSAPYSAAYASHLIEFIKYGARWSVFSWLFLPKAIALTLILLALPNIITGVFSHFKLFYPRGFIQLRAVLHFSVAAFVGAGTAYYLWNENAYVAFIGAIGGIVLVKLIRRPRNLSVFLTAIIVLSASLGVDKYGNLATKSQSMIVLDRASSAFALFALRDYSGSAESVEKANYLLHDIGYNAKGYLGWKVSVPVEVWAAFSADFELYAQDPFTEMSQRKLKEVSEAYRRQPQGEEIKFVQKFLNRNGFNAGPVDGILGGNTRRALKMWQAQEGLRPDGELRPASFVRIHQGSEGST